MAYLLANNPRFTLPARMVPAARGRRRLGFGDILNPSAGTSLDCGFFAGGVFRPECWCYDFATACKALNPEAYAATMTLANPDLHIPVLPVLGKGATAPADAQTPIDPSVAVAQQTRLNQATNLSVVQAFADSSGSGSGSGSGLSSFAWVALALATVGVVGAVAIGGSR